MIPTSVNMNRASRYVITATLAIAPTGQQCGFPSNDMLSNVLDLEQKSGLAQIVTNVPSPCFNLTSVVLYSGEIGSLYFHYTILTTSGLPKEAA